jgi:hypothetical protein
LDRARLERHHVRRLEEPGYTVKPFASSSRLSRVHSFIFAGTHYELPKLVRLPNALNPLFGMQKPWVRVNHHRQADNYRDQDGCNQSKPAESIPAVAPGAS